jgi:hypothetical protein
MRRDEAIAKLKETEAAIRAQEAAHIATRFEP